MALSLRPLLPTLVLSLLLLSGCDKNKEEEVPLPDEPVYTKALTFHVFTETNYNESRWDDSKMKVSLLLRRRNTTLPKEEVLLDTTIGWIPFRQLPFRNNPILVNRLVRDVHKDEETLLLEVTKVVLINDFETELSYTQQLDHAKQQEIVEVKL